MQKKAINMVKNLDKFHKNLRDYNFMCYSKTLAYTIVCILQHSFILEWKPEVWSCNLWFTHVSMMLKPLNSPPVFSLMFCSTRFDQVPYFIAPDPRSLPSIPENVSVDY